MKQFLLATFTLFLISLVFDDVIAQRFLPLSPNNSFIPPYPGPNRELTDITFLNQKLLFSGSFNMLGQIPANRLGYWNGEDYEAFEPQLAQMSPSRYPYTILNSTQGLFVAGRMDPYNHVALLENNEWITPGNGFDDRVFRLIEFNNQILAFGRFTMSGNNEARYAALFNGESWESLGGGMNGPVHDVLVFQNDLYVVGEFTEAGESEALRIAKWDGNSWSQVGNGLDDTANALEEFDGEIIIGGHFEYDGTQQINLNGLAKLNEQELVPLPNISEPISVSFLHAFEGQLFISNGSITSQVLGNDGYVYSTNQLRQLETHEPQIKKSIPYNGHLYVLTGDESDEQESNLFTREALLIYSHDGRIKETLGTSVVQLDAMPVACLVNDHFYGRGTYTFDDFLTTLYSVAPWMGAMEDDELQMNYAHFNGFEEDDLNHYWFGPFSDSYDHEYLEKYFRVWRVNSEEIEYHSIHFGEADYSIPEAIANWPGNGRVENSESAHLAPFIDIDENGWYEPENGDYPAILGDEAIYYLLNTSRYGIGADQTAGIELEVMLYQFNQSDNEDLANTTFVRYELNNKSELDYEQFNFGLFADFDIGGHVDDYVGCFLEENFFYGYNGNSFDFPSSISPGFGDFIPAQSVRFLNDSLRACLYYNNSSGTNGWPMQSGDFYNYMNAKWKNGQHVLWGGDGLSELTGADPNQPTNYMFPSDPTGLINEETWNEVSAGNPPGDRRMMGSIAPLSLASGESICIDVALISAFPDVPGDGISSSIPKLRTRNQVIQSFYDDLNISCSPPVFPLSIEAGKLPEYGLLIYPNPTENTLNVKLVGGLIRSIHILDLNGRPVSNHLANSNLAQLDISNLASGLYLVQAETEEGIVITKKLMIK